MGFKIVRRRKFAKSPFNPDPTGGTATPTTTYRYVGSSESATDLQYRKTDWSLNGIIPRISEGETPAPLPLIANLCTAKDKSD
jgi:hypothetical protein